MTSQQPPTFGAKVKMGVQVAGSLLRHPKNLVALVRYQQSVRKQRKQSGTTGV